MQEVSGAYTSPFLDTDELKMAIYGPKIEKRALGPPLSGVFSGVEGKGGVSYM